MGNVGNAVLAALGRMCRGRAPGSGFGRVISEVGVAMMLGGNIRWYTRTMTTAIALETSKGEFAFGLALGIVLMLISFSINVGLSFMQEEHQP